MNGWRPAIAGALLALCLVPTAASASPAAPGMALVRVVTSEPVVALTFDACPTRRGVGLDREVFAFLRQEHIPATVFLSGLWMREHWSDARALADEPLMELGNHSYAHPPFSTLSVDKGRAEIQETEHLIGLLGRRSVGFRPPFGDWAGWLPQETGGLPVVLWDVVSGDAGGHVPVAQMIEGVTREVRPGSIVIFHINGNGPLTAQALPEIVRRLRARGLRFVHVSDLLGLHDATIVRAYPAQYRPAHPAAPLPVLIPIVPPPFVEGG